MDEVKMYSTTVKVHMQLNLAMKKDLRREKKSRKADRRSGLSSDMNEMNRRNIHESRRERVEYIERRSEKCKRRKG